VGNLLDTSQTTCYLEAVPFKTAIGESNGNWDVDRWWAMYRGNPPVLAFFP